MTDYTFRAVYGHYFENWNNPTIWVGGVVPNSNDADVSFPLVTTGGSQTPFLENVEIQSGETFNTHSILLNDTLDVYGTLNVVGSLNQQVGSLNVGFGVLNAGSIEVATSLNDSGKITVGALVSDEHASIYGANGGEIDAQTFANAGQIVAPGPFTLNVAPGGFANFSSGTLSGGAYTATTDQFDHTVGNLVLNVGGTITTDAARITLDGGTISSHDPISGHDVPITTSLTSVAPGGILQITSGSYTFNPLTVSGHLYLGGSVQFASSQLTTSQLTIGVGADLRGIQSHGSNQMQTVNATLHNDGLVKSDPYTHLVINGAITGTGQIEVASLSSVELNGAVNQNVTFRGDALVLHSFVGGDLKIDQPALFMGTITPITANDGIILAGIAVNSITATSYSGNANAGTLTLQQAGGQSTSLNFIGNFTTSSFALTAGSQTLSSDPPSLLIRATPQAAICFCAGTMILTPSGERPVEALTAGDLVTTASDEVRPIIWTGSSTRLVSPLDPRSRPVIVRAGALADNTPCRDLRITEGHSLYLDGILIPAASLVNGRTILWDEAARFVKVHHIELAVHDLLVADGASAESYRDDGNRRGFTRVQGEHSGGAMPPCAPVRTEGPIVDAAWRRLVDRAGGFVAALSGEPDLHLVADGIRYDPVRADGSRRLFIVRAIGRTIRIASRSAVPALTGTARDMRRLGVALRSIELSGSGRKLALDYASPLLTEGFHEAEHDGRMRWTDGSAILAVPAHLRTGWLEVSLEIACTTYYVEGEVSRRTQRG